jgi:hypothetical protein
VLDASYGADEWVAAADDTNAAGAAAAPTAGRVRLAPVSPDAVRRQLSKRPAKSALRRVRADATGAAEAHPVGVAVVDTAAAAATAAAANGGDVSARGPGTRVRFGADQVSVFSPDVSMAEDTSGAHAQAQGWQWPQWGEAAVIDEAEDFPVMYNNDF